MMLPIMELMLDVLLVSAVVNAFRGCKSVPQVIVRFHELPDLEKIGIMTVFLMIVFEIIGLAARW